LLNISAANAQLGEIVDLYRSTRKRIREAIVLALRTDDRLGPSTRRANALGNLAQFNDLLSEYCDTSQYQGRFMGFVVSYGFSRTLLVTFIAVVLAFWTVLKGLNVVLTAEQACPIR
jgi:hypothetical protein